MRFDVMAAECRRYDDVLPSCVVDEINLRSEANKVRPYNKPPAASRPPPLKRGLKSVLIKPKSAQICGAKHLRHLRAKNVCVLNVDFQIEIQ